MAQGNGKVDYFKAIEKLEKLRLVRVDRTAENYTGWILLEP